MRLPLSLALTVSVAIAPLPALAFTSARSAPAASRKPGLVRRTVGAAVVSAGLLSSLSLTSCGPILERTGLGKLATVAGIDPTNLMTAVSLAPIPPQVKMGIGAGVGALAGALYEAPATIVFHPTDGDGHVMATWAMIAKNKTKDVLAAWGYRLSPTQDRELAALEEAKLAQLATSANTPTPLFQNTALSATAHRHVQLTGATYRLALNSKFGPGSLY